MRVNGGQAVVKSLEDFGVDVVFGLPGVHIMYIYDALYDSRIRHILVRHEQSAAFMADAYSRVTGRVGVCIATVGPGLTNAITAVATAYCDSSPLLLITGQIPSRLIGLGKGALHEVDQSSIVKPITKWSRCVRGVEEIPLAVSQAFKLLKSRRPRPIILEVPIDVLESVGDVAFDYEGEDVERPSGSQESIEEACGLLHKSTSPIILAGGGVLRSGASEELAKLSELLSAPVVTTLMGKGAMPEDHPLSLGCVNRGGVIDEVLAEADLMLAIGTRFSSVSTRGWSLKIPENLIHVDIDEGEIGRNYPAKVKVVGDAKTVLRDILQRLVGKASANRREWLNWVGGLKERAKIELEQSENIEVKTILRIRRILDRDAIVAADVTIPSYWMVRMFEVYRPRTFLYPAGYMPTGYGLPAAISSKLAYPERQVVAVCGDGGFMMTCQELATAVENDANITIIIHNNKSYGILKHVQKTRFKGRYIGVDLANPDFIKLAESFGAKGLKVNSLERLEPCIKEALKADKPTIIDMEIPFEPP